MPWVQVLRNQARPASKRACPRCPGSTFLLAFGMKAVNEFAFRINLQGSPQAATLRFASEAEIQRYHRSLPPFARQAPGALRDAVEFTRLAAKRWRYYSHQGEAAKSLTDLRHRIRPTSTCEVAFIMVATIRQDRRDLPLGLAYCRRTWCHHPALDFLALHPRALAPGRRIRGVGSGIVFGLVQLARALRIPRIWGEATVNSAPFYEKLLAIRPVQDLFIIGGPEMSAIAERQEKACLGLATRRRGGVQ